MKFLISAAGILVAMFFSIPALAQTRALVTEELMVKTTDPGIEIYVRHFIMERNRLKLFEAVQAFPGRGKKAMTASGRMG